MRYSSGALFEILYPFVISLLGVVGSFFLIDCWEFDFDGLVDASLNLFGILIGFLITVLTVINTIENKYTRALRDQKNYNLLMSYLKHSIWGCFYSIALAIIHIFATEPLSGLLMKMANLVFLFGFLYALLCSYRFIRIFLKLTLR